MPINPLLIEEAVQNNRSSGRPAQPTPKVLPGSGVLAPGQPKPFDAIQLGSMPLPWSVVNDQPVNFDMLGEGVRAPRPTVSYDRVSLRGAPEQSPVAKVLQNEQTMPGTPVERNLQEESDNAKYGFAWGSKGAPTKEELASQRKLFLSRPTALGIRDYVSESGTSDWAEIAGRKAENEKVRQHNEATMLASQGEEVRRVEGIKAAQAAALATDPQVHEIMRELQVREAQRKILESDSAMRFLVETGMPATPENYKLARAIAESQAFKASLDELNKLKAAGMPDEEYKRKWNALAMTAAQRAGKLGFNTSNAIGNPTTAIDFGTPTPTDN